MPKWKKKKLRKNKSTKFQYGETESPQGKSRGKVVGGHADGEQGLGTSAVENCVNVPAQQQQIHGKLLPGRRFSTFAFVSVFVRRCWHVGEHKLRSAVGLLPHQMESRKGFDSDGNRSMRYLYKHKINIRISRKFCEFR